MKRIAKPQWLKIGLPNTADYNWMNQTIKNNNLNTICKRGRCPNAAECWGNGTATFMILGDICTRDCKFCNVQNGNPLTVDSEEPLRVAKSVQIMKLKHTVITSVTRDDLEDGGASIWAETIRKIKEINPTTTIECLIPDFQGKQNLVQKVIDAKPEVISHNMETVRNLTPKIRSKAKYETSISVLEYIAKNALSLRAKNEAIHKLKEVTTPMSHNAGKVIIAKSGIMLGLGETENEVLETMDDLITVGVTVLTIGQYLQPSKNNIEVSEFITPEKFEFYKEEGLKRGFKFVESAPLVRSSYHAEKHC